MFKLLRCLYASAGVLGIAAGLCAPAMATMPDSTLFTTYTVATDLKSANWVICGSTQATEGCYSSGNIGPFGRIGAMMQDPPSFTDGGLTVTRHVYVLDVASGTAGNGVTLYVYTKKEVISSTYDTATVTLTHTISLPLVGGSTVKASMAANIGHLYVGTNQSTQAAVISKTTWVASTVGGFSSPLPVSSITSDTRGYVTVTFGAPGETFSGFYVFGPTGAVEDGGGGNFMLDTSNGVVPVPLP